MFSSMSFTTSHTTPRGGANEAMYMYAGMRLCTCMHTHTHTPVIYTRAHRVTCIPPHTQAWIMSYLHTHTHTHTHRHTNTRTHTHTCVHVTSYHVSLHVQSHLYYDRWWCVEHAFLVWANSFVFLSTHLLPPSYCQLLHQCALHLGCWTYENASM